MELKLHAHVSNQKNVIKPNTLNNHDLADRFEHFNTLNNHDLVDRFEHFNTLNNHD